MNESGVALPASENNMSNSHICQQEFCDDISIVIPFGDRWPSRELRMGRAKRSDATSSQASPPDAASFAFSV